MQTESASGQHFCSVEVPVTRCSLDVHSMFCSGAILCSSQGEVEDAATSVTYEGAH